MKNEYQVGDVLMILMDDSRPMSDDIFFNISVVASKDVGAYSDKNFLFLLDDIYDLTNRNYIDYQYPFYEEKGCKILKYYGNLEDIVGIKYKNYSFIDENNAKVINYIKNIDPEYFI